MIEIGQQYGEWTVEQKDPSNSAKWLCSCSCGSHKSVYGSTLKSGTSKSCGCNRINIEIGQRFGQLTVLRRHGSSPEGHSLWDCLCDCGQEKVIVGSSLSKGMTKSCGCLSRNDNGHRSHNETVFEIILTTLQIPFQYEPETFTLPTGETYTPDFYLPERDLWIELKSSRDNLLKAAVFGQAHNLMILTSKGLDEICGSQSLHYLYIKGRNDIGKMKSLVETAAADNKEKIFEALDDWKDFSLEAFADRIDNMLVELREISKWVK